MPQNRRFTFCKKPSTPAVPSDLATKLDEVAAALAAHPFGTECASLESLPVLESWSYLLGAQVVECNGQQSLRLGRVPICAYGSQGILLQNVTINGSDCLACQ